MRAKQEVDSIDGQLFKKEILQFAKRWKEPIRIHKDVIENLSLIALGKIFLELSASNGNYGLVEYYRQCPDFTLAALQLLRAHWKKLDKSKFGRLKKYFAISPPPAGALDKNICDLFKLWSERVYGVCDHVDEQLVKKARQWVYRKKKRAENFASKSYDHHGMISCMKRRHRNLR